MSAAKTETAETRHSLEDAGITPSDVLTLDKNGWETRKCHILSEGKIYTVYLRIAKAADGRFILYTVNINKEAGVDADLSSLPQGAVGTTTSTSVYNSTTPTAESQPISENSSDEDRHSYEDYDEEGYIRRMRDELERKPGVEKSRYDGVEPISADEYERGMRD